MSDVRQLSDAKRLQLITSHKLDEFIADAPKYKGPEPRIDLLENNPRKLNDDLSRFENREKILYDFGFGVF